MQSSIKRIVAPIALLVCVLLLSVAEYGASQATQSAPAAPATPATPAQAPTPQPIPNVPAQAAQTPQETQTHVPTTFFVMIDPSHGGTDQGALLGDKLLEKDVTLAFARRLKAELEDHGISARLLRDGDASVSLEQRAETANAQHAGIYLALHAGMPGQGVRIYTPALVASSASVGKFLLWEAAQSAYMARSRMLAQAVAGEVGKKDVKVLNLSTSLRPLNNITAPAIAVELAPDPNNIQDIAGQKFQSTVAAGVAAGVAQVRSQWEAQR